MHRHFYRDHFYVLLQNQKAAMRILLLGCLILLSSTFTLAATVPANSGLTLGSPPSTDIPEPPFCLRDDPVCPRPLLADCNGLLGLLTLNTAGARSLREFVSRPPEAAYEWQVPSTFTSRSCRITLAMVPGEVLELSSFAEIAEKATPLATNCLGATTPQYYGGYNIAGIADTLMILMHGVPKENAILAQGGGAANHTGADLTRTAANDETWCRRIDEGRIYSFDELKQTLNHVNGSFPASGTGSVAPVERVDVTK